MCEVCESRFNVAATHFDEFFAAYKRDEEEGRMRDTPAERVCDTAQHITKLALVGGPGLLPWFLAICLERLHSAQKAGLPI